MKSFLIASAALALLSAAHGVFAEEASAPAAYLAKALRQASRAALPDDEDVDAKTHWDQLANEAKLMQVMIAEGRTHEQCVDQCNRAENINRARCRRNCDSISDSGNGSNTRSMSCSDCRATFNPGRRLDRCLQACGQAQDRCRDARSCSGCRRCSGGALDRCRDRWCDRSRRSDDDGFRRGGRNTRRSNRNSRRSNRNSRRSNRNSRDNCNCRDFFGSQYEDCKDGRGDFRNCNALAAQE